LGKINIAIDGYAGTGKSSTAKEVARRLNYLYIDTGAMYRAVTLHFLRENIPFEKESASLQNSLQQLEIDFVNGQANGKRAVTLNGQIVEKEIRSLEVNKAVSPVSTLVPVRHALVAQQQRMALRKGVVMDGRDIGTVVLPDAELKVFMTANMDIRAKRRLAEMQAKGLTVSLEEVKTNLMERDKIDSSRSEGPLRKADDAIEIDTSYLQLEDQIEKILDLAYKLISA
jgi:cytidylate kinase